VRSLITSHCLAARGPLSADEAPFRAAGKAPSVVHDSTADKQGLLLAYQNAATGLVQIP